MKDPAFLFYPNDWSGGTIAYSRHMKGGYIDLLVAQFNLGPMTLDEVKTVLGSDFGTLWPALQKKFPLLPDGTYCNSRLKLEQDKRKNFSASRKKNREGNHMSPHMEDGNEDRNIIKNIYGEFKRVNISEENYQKLVEKLGEQNTQTLIAELDRYIETKGKDDYKNHYAVIQTWANRRVNDHKEKKQLQNKRIRTLV